MTKSRFCPSPTGRMHLGNVRTALFNALIAHHDNGIFLLRIEDTDAERSREEYVDGIQEDLTWLGATWHEGLGCGGEHSPYFQSERNDIYSSYYQSLIEQGVAYPCFCSPEELELSRKMQRRRGIAPRYAGTCSHLSAEEIALKEAAGLKPTLRFKVPKDAVIEFTDSVRGLQKFQANDIGDFIIRRADGGATFMFCNAVDDATMGVTIALRGEDHLTNSPRQIMILDALKLKAPQYGHISLIVGDDGSPLSKRHGSKSIQMLREEGYLPKAILNYLARLGHSYVDHNELMSFAECAQFFSMAHLVKAAAKYDEQQLLHWQKESVLALSMPEFIEWLGDEVLADIPEEKKTLFATTVKPNTVFPGDAIEWKRRIFDGLDFVGDTRSVLEEAGILFFEAALNNLDNANNFKGLADVIKKQCKVKGKQLFMPLRIAMTGVKQGPEMAQLFELIGKEGLKTKFTKVIAELSK